MIGCNEPRSLALRGGEVDFGLNVASNGLQEGPALSCQGLVSCHSLRWHAPKCLAARAQLARATVNWAAGNSYFMAELLGRGKGLLGFVMFGASKHYTKINLIGGVYTAQMQCEFYWTEQD